MAHGSQPPEFLLTHPLPQNRIERQLAKAEKNQSSRNPLEYQLANAAIGRYSR